jgi:hypothetical protein
MNGTPWKEIRDISFVQQQRAMNKVFGLEPADKWSGHKVLIDFLDELFNAAKPAIAKLDKSVSHVFYVILEQGLILPASLRIYGQSRLFLVACISGPCAAGVFHALAACKCREAGRLDTLLESNASSKYISVYFSRFLYPVSCENFAARQLKLDYHIAHPGNCTNTGVY